MSFATDKDLLVLEPNLFRDLTYLGQTLAGGTDGALAGTQLTSASSNFGAVGVTGGHVVVVNGMALEVIARVSGTVLEVSKLRPLEDGPVIPPGPVTGAMFTVTSFGPQIAHVHAELMAALGIGVSGSEHSEAQIVNGREMARLEGLGALAVVFMGAAALVGEAGLLWTKAQSYRDRYHALRRRGRALLDTDGDGLADVTLHMNVAQMTRG